MFSPQTLSMPSPQRYVPDVQRRCSHCTTRAHSNPPTNHVDVLSPQAIRSGLAEAQKVAAGNGDEVEKAEARVEVEVFEALLGSMKA